MDKVLDAIKQVASLLLSAANRFKIWWLQNYRRRSGRGKWLFIGISLLAACCICSVPIVVFSPDTTSMPEAGDTSAVGEVAESEQESQPVATKAATATVEKVGPTDTPTLTVESKATETPTSEPTATAVFPDGEFATVLKVIDGDTIEVQIDEETFRVRYIGMDTPERGMPFFDEATEANSSMVAGTNVILVKDVSETDRYNRLLRYVYLEDGTFVNAELVQQGYAQIATYPPDVEHEKLFHDLQVEARENELGLWSVVAVAPEPTEIAQPTNTPGQTTPTSLPTQLPQPSDTPIPVSSETPVPPPTEPLPAAPGNVQITFINFDGQVARVESDEYAQITNQGGSPVNLSGWRLNADDAGQDFWFPSFDLQPGQSCRVYTNEYHPDTCGFSFGNGQALWNNSDRECGHLFDPSGVEVSTYCY